MIASPMPPVVVKPCMQHELLIELRGMCRPRMLRTLRPTQRTAAPRPRGSALERMTQAYTNSRQYYMLDDLVEATGAAKKVSALPFSLHLDRSVTSAVCCTSTDLQCSSDQCLLQGRAYPQLTGPLVWGDAPGSWA